MLGSHTLRGLSAKIGMEAAGIAGVVYIWLFLPFFIQMEINNSSLLGISGIVFLEKKFWN
jgi:hypothetical protein